MMKGAFDYPSAGATIEVFRVTRYSDFPLLTYVCKLIVKIAVGFSSRLAPCKKSLLRGWGDALFNNPSLLPSPLNDAEGDPERPSPEDHSQERVQSYLA